MRADNLIEVAQGGLYFHIPLRVAVATWIIEDTGTAMSGEFFHRHPVHLKRATHARPEDQACFRVFRYDAQDFQSDAVPGQECLHGVCCHFGGYFIRNGLFPPWDFPE